MAYSSRSSTDAIDTVLRRLEQVSRSSVVSAQQPHQPQQNDSHSSTPPAPKRPRLEKEATNYPHKAAVAAVNVSELQSVNTVPTGAGDSTIQLLPENLSTFMDAFGQATQPSEQYLHAFNASLTRYIASSDQDVSKNKSEHPMARHALFTSLDSEIRLSLYGEIVIYDLCTLEAQPQGIISLLKLAMSDRAAWMVVAAYYRRKRLAFAAIAVVTSMLDVMRKHGFCDADLKPAFVLLSACETDLARDPRCSDRPHHAKNAERWLQKALGPAQMDYDSFPPLAEPAPVIKEGLKKETTPSSHSAPSDSRGGRRSDQAGYQRILERENESLRDRLDRVHSQVSSLESARSAQRKLENEVTRERDLRRAAEKKVHSLEHALETSKRMEGYAIAGQRREFEARKKAEARADRDSTARVSMEHELRRCQAEEMEYADLTEDYSAWSPHPAFEV